MKGTTKKKTKSERVNLRLLARVVQSELSGLRRSTAKTKRRGEVRGGGKKPWKQKGTGRARVGSIRSPLWRGGGTVFGPDGTQNFYAKVNSKERKVALDQAISLHLLNKTLTEVELPAVKKTKDAAAWLRKEGIVDRPLLVIGPKETIRAFRNLKRVSVASTDQLTPVLVLSARQIVRAKATANPIQA